MSRRDPATSYARAVVRGREVAGPHVRHQCQRHLDDLERDDLEWRLEYALHAIAFFEETLRLEQGPFLLQPFQKFIVGSIFGWYNEHGFRRFRTAYVEGGKGIGKTPLAAGIGLCVLMCDGQEEPEVEVYAAASTKEQASIVFSDAANMVLRSPALQEIVEVNAESLIVHPTSSTFKVVSSQDRGKSGPRVQCALVDELHEHLNSAVVDKMRLGTKTRRNALIFEITNAGYDRASVCWDHHQYSIRVAEGRDENDAWFPYVCALDEEDDWTDEKHWRKTSPGLGTILPKEYLRELVRESKGQPSKENLVKRLNFCIWTDTASAWMPIEYWKKCAENQLPDLSTLAGELAFAGLLLQVSKDISAFVIVVPKDGKFHVYPWFWCPEADIITRSEQDNAPYIQWSTDVDVPGAHSPTLLVETDGDTTDFALIEKHVAGVFERFGLRFGGLMFDPQSSGHMATRLQTEHGFDVDRVIKVSKTFGAQTEATKHTERIFKAGKVVHGGNAILKRNFDFVSVKQKGLDPTTKEPAEVMIDRQESGENVCGLEAFVIAMVGWVKQLKEEEEESGSVLLW